MIRLSHPATLLVATLLASVTATAQTLPPAPGGLLAPERADRIVGLWSSTVELGACAGGPRMQFKGLNQFHAGGTLTETGSPPSGSRGPGLGAWRFERGSQRYEARMQFFRFRPDGNVDGVTDIHRDIRLSFDGSTYNDTVVARLLDLDGNLVVELCGTAVGQRVRVL